MQPHIERTSDAPPPTCLIVEDSRFDIEKMQRVLARAHCGLEVTVATTLASARAALTEGQAALILLDNNLPDGLGTNFAMELAEDERLAQIPVIMVSDWPSPFMWEKAAAAGVRYVLSKREFDTRYVLAALKPGQRARVSVH